MRDNVIVWQQVNFRRRDTKLLQLLSYNNGSWSAVFIGWICKLLWNWCTQKKLCQHSVNSRITRQELRFVDCGWVCGLWIHFSGWVCGWVCGLCISLWTMDDGVDYGKFCGRVCGQWMSLWTMDDSQIVAHLYGWVFWSSCNQLSYTSRKQDHLLFTFLTKLCELTIPLCNAEGLWLSS